MNQKMVIYPIITGNPTRVFDLAQIKSDSGKWVLMGAEFRIATDSGAVKGSTGISFAPGSIAAARD
jgi:hypothetical protein